MMHRILFVPPFGEREPILDRQNFNKDLDKLHMLLQNF